MKKINWINLITYGAILIVTYLFWSMILSCNKPYCEYQENSSCEIYTNGDRDFITVMAKGQHLCCWYATFEGCRYWTPERIVVEMIDWYEEIVNENAECLLKEENCGPSWAYGQVIN